MRCWRWSLVGVWSVLAVSGCATGEDERAVSAVAMTWESTLGGGSSSPARRMAVQVSPSSFDILDDSMGFLGGVDRYPNPYAEDPPVAWVDANPSLTLPESPTAFEQVAQEGLSFSAITYCGFLNEPGFAREKDIAAMERALAVWSDAVLEPFRRSAFEDEGLTIAAREAANDLFAKVLETFEAQGVGDPFNSSAFVRVLSLHTSNPHDLDRPLATTFQNLLQFIPDLVRLYGDSTTRRTLAGCGSGLLFNTPWEVTSRFPNRFNGSCFAGASEATCSVQNLSANGRGTYTRDDVFVVGLRPGYDGPFFARWWIVNQVTLEPAP